MRLRKQGNAALAQRCATGIALQQDAFEKAFQALDALANRSLGQMQLSRRRADAAGLSNGNEGAQQGEIEVTGDRHAFSH